MKATFANRDFTKLCKDNVKRVFFVYIVSGTQEELESFRVAQAANYKVGDDPKRPNEFGKPLWFSLDYHGEICTVNISKNNKVYADNSEMRKMASIAKQYGANLGDAIAHQFAAQMLGKQAVAPQQAPQIVPPEQDLGDL